MHRIETSCHRIHETAEARARASRRGLGRAFRLALAALLLSAGGLPLTLPIAAQADEMAEDVDPEVELRETWQRKYRNLLRDAARLRRNVAASEADYKRAQRRNYPRGDAREQIVRNGNESRRDLVRVEAAIEKLQGDARAAGVRPGWLYDVEQEDFGPAPAAAATESEESDRDREGRNPIYFDDDEE